MTKGHPYKWRDDYPVKVAKRSGGNYLYGVADDRYNGETNVVIKDSHDVKVAVSDQDVMRVAEEKGYIDEDGKITKKGYVRAGVMAVDLSTSGTSAIVSVVGETALTTLFGLLFEIAIS